MAWKCTLLTVVSDVPSCYAAKLTNLCHRPYQPVHLAKGQ